MNHPRWTALAFVLLLALGCPEPWSPDDDVALDDDSAGDDDAASNECDEADNEALIDLSTL